MKFQLNRKLVNWLIDRMTLSNLTIWMKDLIDYFMGFEKEKDKMISSCV